MRWLILCAMVACSEPTPAPCPPSPPRAVLTPVAATPPAAAPTQAPAPAPGMITDEQCIAGGGYVDTGAGRSRSRRHPYDANAPVPSYRVCRYPNAAVGKACEGEADCNGARCMCSGALGRPDPETDPALVKLDHTPGTGVCRDNALPDGSWFCMVKDGIIHLDGIIID